MDKTYERFDKILKKIHFNLLYYSIPPLPNQPGTLANCIEYDCNDDKWCSFGQVSINPQGRRGGGEGFWGYKFGCFTIFLILECENTHYAYIIVVRFIFKVEIYKIL